MAEEPHDNQNKFLEEAVEQFVDAQLQGQEPVIDEFVKKYPDFKHQVRKRLRKLRKIDTLFASLVKPDESDFEDTAADQNLVGEKVGSFEISEIIGRGGMGVVYLARDSKLKRSVAIKSIPAKLAGDSNSRTRFRREAEILASLNHPNIAVIHDIIEQEEDAGYLVLEYVPGETLAERIAHEPLKMKEALSIGRQISQAVSAVHKKGIVHRDLKPSNIKIIPDGRVKVLDFGLAKPPINEDKKNDITATEPGRVIGTPAYMSPEQARGKPTDHRTDIWSFGCIMYQMLTGKFPFEGETATDTLARIIERQPDWELLPKETPENIRVLLQSCLEKDPDKRLGDIAAAAIEISETLSKPLIAQASKLRRIAMIIGAVAIGIILFVIALKFIPQKVTQPSSKLIRLVVLPFENLGPSNDDYFADGITDEITARLAGIHNLGVISRQSAIQYKKSKKNSHQIAEELGIDYILEGTIQRETSSDPNSPIRIRPQLIKASNDMHIWADVYNSNMSDIFNLQAEVTKQVAQVLDITLLEEEKVALESIPTKNMEAWNYYLRGNEYLSRDSTEINLKIAIGMWKDAIRLDPQFTLAYTQLSCAYTSLYWIHSSKSEDIEEAKEHAQAAKRLDPHLPEVHLAWGRYYYQGQRDYERALKELAIVLKSRPYDDEALSWTGWVYKRQGNFEKALEYLERAYEFGPRHYSYPFHIAVIYELLNRYDKAESFYNQAISLAPDSARNYNGKMCLYLRQGDTMKARAVLKEFSQYPNVAEDSEIMNTQVKIDVYEGNYKAALDRLSSETVINWPGIYPNALRKARIYEYWKKDNLAKEHYDKARILLERKIAEKLNSSNYQSILGVAYAGLGLKDKAIHAGEEAVKKPSIVDAVAGPQRVLNLARIYTMVGKYDKALDQIEYLLSIPGPLSIPLLKIDPAWEPLRNHPRFKKLIDSDK